jgi:hypothetical protein
MKARLLHVILFLLIIIVIRKVRVVVTVSSFTILVRERKTAYSSLQVPYQQQQLQDLSSLYKASLLRQIQQRKYTQRYTQSKSTIQKSKVSKVSLNLNTIQDQNDYSESIIEDNIINNKNQRPEKMTTSANGNPNPTACFEKEVCITIIVYYFVLLLYVICKSSQDSRHSFSSPLFTN